MAQPHKVTAGMIVQAAWGLLLSRYTGGLDVVFGETRACRRPVFEGTPAVVGVVMNTVPIRLRLCSAARFTDLIQDLRAQHIALREYENTSLSDIREWNGISGVAEMFNSLVVFEEFELDSALRREGCTLWQRGIQRSFPAH